MKKSGLAFSDCLRRLVEAISRLQRGVRQPQLDGCGVEQQFVEVGSYKANPITRRMEILYPRRNAGDEHQKCKLGCSFGKNARARQERAVRKSRRHFPSLMRRRLRGRRAIPVPLSIVVASARRHGRDMVQNEKAAFRQPHFN